jgi:hypothetical protein
MRIDVHQHLWPAPFVAALRARRTPPRLDGWTLHLPGERAYAIDPAQHDPVARAATDPADLILVAPSAACGFDRLPPDEAAELAAAWHEGALALPAPFRAWAMASTLAPDAGALEEAVRHGAAGLEVAADVLASPGGLDHLAPLLDVLEDAGLPLLVHPGPAGSAAAPGRPDWWAPVVPYVAQLHAAWWAWADEGRARFPRLPVCFAALAGLGPLHGERQRARGGAGGPVDPLTFVETSSYGAQAVDAVVRALGIDVVCHGSDRPYAEPAWLGYGAAAEHAIHSANPGRLLARLPQEVSA